MQWSFPPLGSFLILPKELFAVQSVDRFDELNVESRSASRWRMTTIEILEVS
jgi:hypothetical protein